MGEARQIPDEALAAFVREDQPSRSEKLLEVLIADHADPVIRGIVGFRLGYSGTVCDRQSIDDVCGEARLRLLARLESVKAGNTSIAKFKSYVAVTAHNACSDYLRDTHPVHRSLSDQIKYCVEKDPSLLLWKGEDGKDVVGLPEWRSKEAVGIGDRIPQLLEAFTANSFDRPSPSRLKGVRLMSLARRMLELHQQPLRVADLVALVADWVGVTHSVASEMLDGPDPSPAPTAEQEAMWRSDLQRSWEGILRLDLSRRRAILLNLGEGADLKTLIVNKIATPAAIAQALGISIGAFTSLLPRLPMENEDIAREFDFKDGQQVNNTRQWGRKLLKKFRGSEWK